jgi:hypothetical protein
MEGQNPSIRTVLENVSIYALLRQIGQSARLIGSPIPSLVKSPRLPRRPFGKEQAPETKEIEEIRRRMQALLDSFDYDFSQFALSGFAKWVGKRRGRKVIFLPYHFVRPRVSGAWVEDADYDYIFFETRDAPPVLQAHSQFHEFSHILCGHSTASVTPADIALLLSHSGCCDQGQITSVFFCTSGELDEATREHELEAEMLSSLMRELILRSSRLEELLKAVPSNMHQLSYFDSLKVS